MVGQAGSKQPAPDLKVMQRNDLSLEAEIHARLLPGLRIMLRHKLRASAAVDDLVQETLIVVLQHWRSGEIAESAQLVAFARATASHLIANLKRADRRREHLTLEMAHALEPEFSPSPERLLVDAEIAILVRSAVAALSNLRDRQLLWRYYVQEQSKVDVCDALKMDLRRFDKVLHRARSRLREHMLRTLGAGGTSNALETLSSKVKVE